MFALKHRKSAIVAMDTCAYPSSIWDDRTSKMWILSLLIVRNNF